MAIKKTIKFTTDSITLPPTSSAHVNIPTTHYTIHPPLGEKPEGNMDALNKLENAMKSLFANMDKLRDNLEKLKEENKKQRDIINKFALGIVESPLVLTEDMEVKNGH
tara:strand:- start:420 stop:743 length:324 start_codon:yes stop_codon:yes gene_type:complete